MKTYIKVMQNTWEEIVTYRVNFIMWRARTVLQLLTAYFLWLAIIPTDGSVFGYTQTTMLTYIILTQLFWAITMASRGQEIGQNIVSGDLSTFLIRPVNYFLYWFARDIGDKLMNVSFSIIEIAILIFILKPPFFFQTDPFILILVVISTLIAILINFIISSLLSMVGFWSQDIWAPRFLFWIIVGFFAGTMFPLDIFPKAISNFLEFLPTSYLIYFPIKIYLGQMAIQEILVGIVISLIWVVVGYFVLKIIWHKGLKDYGAYGR